LTGKLAPSMTIYYITIDSWLVLLVDWVWRS